MLGWQFYDKKWKWLAMQNSSNQTNEQVDIMHCQHVVVFPPGEGPRCVKSVFGGFVLIFFYCRASPRCQARV